MLKENSNCGPFRATRLWDEAVNLFVSGMPRKRHRNHMRQYEDCFTGAEAVKWFCQALEMNPHFNSLITQEKTVQLLSKFFEEGIFVRVKGSGQRGLERFKLNGIYQMGQKKPQYTLRTPLSSTSIVNQNQKEENWIRKSLRKEPFPAYENLRHPCHENTGLYHRTDYENLPPLKSVSVPNLNGKLYFRNPQASANHKQESQQHSPENRAPQHPLQQHKAKQEFRKEQVDRLEEKVAKAHSPGKVGEIWKDVFVERLQSLLTDVDVSGLLWPCAVIRSQWLEQNCTILCDTDGAKFPPWVKAATNRLIDALTDKDMNRSIVNGDIEADVSALEAYFGSLQKPLIPADVSVIYQRVFLHLEMTATSLRKDEQSTQYSPSTSSSCEDSDWWSRNGSLQDVLPPNSCFETAFTSESPITRIIPQCSFDTLHLPKPIPAFSPMKRNVSAPKLLEACRREYEEEIPSLVRSPLSRSTMHNLCDRKVPKFSTIGGSRWENKSKLKSDSIGGSLQKKKSLQLSLSPNCHIASELHGLPQQHHCGQLTVIDKTPPIPPRRMRIPPPIRKAEAFGRKKVDDKHTRSHSGGYINLALQDSFEDPEIKPEELDLEAAMETIQKLMICSQPKSQRSPRKDCQVKSPHVRSASLSQTQGQSPNRGLRRSHSFRSQDLSNASLSSYHTAVSSNALSDDSDSPRAGDQSSRGHSPPPIAAGCEWGWNWGTEVEQKGAVVFGLLSLLLPPQSRAQLQILLRLMGLLPYQCPYTAVKVLEMFSASIIRGSDADMVARLLGFLVRHFKEIFDPPQELVTEVLKRRREMLHRRFEEQKLSASQQALAELLDQILSDHKMTSKEKQKKVKMFKESYPHIYALRFPQPEFADAPQKNRHKSILQLARLRSLRV